MVVGSRHDTPLDRLLRGEREGVTGRVENFGRCRTRQHGRRQNCIGTIAKRLGAARRLFEGRLRPFVAQRIIAPPFTAGCCARRL